jgi:hypothetical protein
MLRYRQLYIERGKPEGDSERFRRRLAASISQSLWAGSSGNPNPLNRVVHTIERQTGCRVPMPGSPENWRLREFFEKASTRDVLDAITIIIRVMEPGEADWRAHVQQVLQEENLAYRLGSDGIVHPYVDQEFEANRVAAIEALGAQKLVEARRSFDEAFRHLRNGEGRQAARMMFPALETTARVLFPGKLAVFGVSEVERYIKPQLEAKYAGNQPAIDAGRQMLEALKKWINASQAYRHGQEVQDLAEPPQELLVAYLSAGAAFLRWIIELADSGTSA